MFQLCTFVKNSKYNKIDLYCPSAPIWSALNTVNKLYPNQGLPVLHKNFENLQDAGY